MSNTRDVDPGCATLVVGFFVLGWLAGYLGDIVRELHGIRVALEALAK